MSELVEKIRAALDEDEAWAMAASQPYESADSGSKPSAGGSHWQWVWGDDWEAVTPDPVTSEFVVEPGEPCWLISVETWPSTSLISKETGETRTRQAPKSYSDQIVEFDSSAAGHIARHDPARVLRQVAAMRRIVDLHEHVPVDEGGIGCVLCAYDTKYGEIINGGYCATVLALAAAYGIDIA